MLASTQLDKLEIINYHRKNMQRIFLTVYGVSFPATLEVLRSLDVFVATARHLHQRQRDVIQLASDGQTKELLEGQHALRQVVALHLRQR